MKGNSSIDVRNRIIQDARRNGDRQLFLFMCTDHDPAGIQRIQDSLIGSLEKDFGQYVDARRVLITEKQIKKYSLPENMEAKKKDSLYERYIEETGTTFAYELENAIRAQIDIDLYNEQVKLFSEDIGEIQRKREKIINAI